MIDICDWSNHLWSKILEEKQYYNCNNSINYPPLVLYYKYPLEKKKIKEERSVFRQFWDLVKF